MTESDREEQKMKVVKFGGSSMADAGQYRKVRDILLADPERRVVVVSAAGKRFGNDHKLTDLLYLCFPAAAVRQSGGLRHHLLIHRRGAGVHPR